MPKYLAIDASTEACSVALSINDHVINEFELCPQSHSVVLLPMVDRILKEANCTLAELDGLIFGRGPGSFTGVRIGIGVAQGLAFSADLPVVGVSTLQAMAQQAYDKYNKTEVISVIDARMSEVYTGIFRADDIGIMQPVKNEAVLSPNKVAEYVSEFTSKSFGVGTGWEAYQQELNALRIASEQADILYPNAQDMITIALPEFNEGKAVSAEHAQPVYVRDTVSWKKLPGR